MANARVADILNYQAIMASRRSSIESVWKDCARHNLIGALPYLNDVSSSMISNPVDPEIVDLTSAQSSKDYVAILQAMIMPRNQKWSPITTGNPDLDKIKAVGDYMQTVSDMLYSVRRLRKSGFGRQNYMRLRMFAVFGPGVMFIEDQMGYGIRYLTVNPKEVFMLSDDFGFLKRVHRRFKLQAHQYVAKFNGPDDVVPQQIKDAASKSPTAEFEVIHAVYPNEDYDPQSRVSTKRKLASCYVDVTTQTEIRMGGYNVMPYTRIHEPIMPGDDYGISHCAFMLPEAKTVNAVDRSNLKTMQIRNAPPLLTYDESMRKIKFKPGAILPGGLDAAGREKIKAMNMGVQPEMGLEMAETRRAVIKKSFFNDLYQFFIQNPNMKATTAMSALQERAALLSPLAETIEENGIAPQVDRELDILSMAGVLPPMPQELREAGGKYQVQFNSPMSRAMLSDEAYGAEATVQRAVGLAAVAPDAMDAIDTDYYLQVTGRADGAPSKLFRDPKEIAARRAQKQQAQNLAMQAEGVTAASTANLNAAKARSLDNAS